MNLNFFGIERIIWMDDNSFKHIIALKNNLFQYKKKPIGT